MASKKVTITLPVELVAEVLAAAEADGVPVSKVIATATARELRRRAGRQVLTEWQAEHGVFTTEELAAARAEAAQADADLLSGGDQRGIA